MLMCTHPCFHKTPGCLSYNLCSGKEEGIEAEGSREELCENPFVIKRVQRDAVELTRETNDYERVKRVYLLPREFSIDKGEMTPTLKIKRGVIDEKYEEAIDEICGS